MLTKRLTDLRMRPDQVTTEGGSTTWVLSSSVCIQHAHAEDIYTLIIPAPSNCPDYELAFAGTEVELLLIVTYRLLMGSEPC